MKKYILVFIICLVLWCLFQFLLNKNKLSSDGFFEVGFPFIFYRDFNGKGNYAELELGVNKINLLWDIIIFFLVTIVVYKSSVIISRSSKSL